MYTDTSRRQSSWADSLYHQIECTAQKPNTNSRRRKSNLKSKGFVLMHQFYLKNGAFLLELVCLHNKSRAMSRTIRVFAYSACATFVFYRCHSYLGTVVYVSPCYGFNIYLVRRYQHGTDYSTRGLPPCRKALALS